MYFQQAASERSDLMSDEQVAQLITQFVLLLLYDIDINLSAYPNMLL